MAAEVIQLVAKISADAKTFTGEINKAKKGMKELVNSAATQTKDIAQSVAVGAGAIGAAISGALAISAGKAQEMRNALGEVASTGVKDLDGLKTAAREFSNQWAGTTAVEFVSAAYDIKSAISTLSDEGVAKMTEMAAITAKATKASTAEMSKAFAVAHGIFKPLSAEMSDVEWSDKFAGAMAYAANIFKTDGKEMSDAIRNIGAVASTANVPLAEQMAIMGMLQQTMPGTEAGTLYKAFMLTIGKAGEKLKLQFIDTNGQLKSTPEILDEIKKKFPDLSQAAAQMQLKEALGSDEALKFVLQMSGQVDVLRQNTEGMSGAFEKGSVVAEEMATAMNTDKIELAKQQFGNLMSQIGEFVLTALGPLLKDISAFLLKLQEWITANPGLTKTIVIITAAVGGLALAIAAIATVVAGIAGVIAVFSGAAFVAIAPVLGIVAIVIGVIATLALAAKLIYDNWGPIKDFFVFLWDSVKAGFVTAWEFIKGVVVGGWEFIKAAFVSAGEALVGGVMLVWDSIIAAVKWYIDKYVAFYTAVWEKAKEAFDKVREVFASFFDAVAPYWENFKNNMLAAWEALKAGPTAFIEFFVGLFKNAFDKVLAMAADLWEKVKNIPGALLDKMKDAVGLGGGSDVPAMATGGIVKRPTFALIGEAGPEAVIPLNGGGIPVNFGSGSAPTATSQSDGGGVGDTYNIYQQKGESSEVLAKRIAEYKMKRRGWV